MGTRTRNSTLILHNKFPVLHDNMSTEEETVAVQEVDDEKDGDYLPPPEKSIDDMLKTDTEDESTSPRTSRPSKTAASPSRRAASSGSKLTSLSRGKLSTALSMSRKHSGKECLSTK